MYSTTLVGIECRKLGSSWSSDRPARAPSTIGMAWSFGTKPGQRTRPWACAGSIMARARASAGPISSTVMPCGRSRAASFDHLADAAVRGQMADVDHPLGGARRVRRGGGLGHVGGVRHHRVRPAEPRDVALLGQDQMHAPLGEPFGGVHGRGGDGRPQRARQPRLGAQRGGGVLVHVPDRGRPGPPRRQRQQQLGIVDQQQVGAGRVPGQLAPGGAQGAEPAPAHGARNRDDLRAEGRSVRQKKSLRCRPGRCR